MIDQYGIEYTPPPPEGPPNVQEHDGLFGVRRTAPGFVRTAEREWSAKARWFALGVVAGMLLMFVTDMWLMGMLWR